MGPSFDGLPGQAEDRLMFATCRTCGQEMDGTSCTSQRAFPWGQEPDWQRPGLRELGGITWQPCRNCNVAPGGYHHERCYRAICALGCADDDPQAAFCRHAPDDDDDDGGEELPIPPPTEPTTQPTIH
jgi:hypothetical protein